MQLHIGRSIRLPETPGRGGYAGSVADLVFDCLGVVSPSRPVVSDVLYKAHATRLPEAGASCWGRVPQFPSKAK